MDIKSINNLQYLLLCFGSIAYPFRLMEIKKVQRPLKEDVWRTLCRI